MTTENVKDKKTQIKAIVKSYETELDAQAENIEAEEHPAEVLPTDGQQDMEVDNIGGKSSCSGAHILEHHRHLNQKDSAWHPAVRKWLSSAIPRA